MVKNSLRVGICLVLVLILGLMVQAQEMVQFRRERDFEEYREIYSIPAGITEPITLEGRSYAYADTILEVFTDEEGRKGVVTSETGFVEWDIFIEAPGLYEIAVTYYPLEGRRSTIQRELLLNGKRPYLEAGFLEFHRIWGDKEEATFDNQGNMLRASQIEKPRWVRKVLVDSMGNYAEPLSFFLEEGWNTITFTGRREPMVIEKVELLPVRPRPNYLAVQSSYQEQGYQETRGVSLLVQGQDAIYRSSPTLFPIFDRSDPTVSPYHHTLIRLNTIGGQRWAQPGDFIIWEVEIKEAGLYQIAIKAKQNIRRGSYSSRELRINGEVPFKEVEAIRFPYSTRYNLTVLGEEEPFLFYFEEGIHEIKLETVLGDLAEILRITQDSLYELNTIYRRIVMITSANPDPMRDYQLQERIPDLIERLRVQSGIIADLSSRLERFTGQKGSHVAVLDDLSRQLLRMAQRPETIPRRLGEFRDNSGALGTWILQTREQPLQIDYLLVASIDVELPRATPTASQVLLHEARSFLASFTHDYTLIGDVHDERKGAREPLKVWVGTGRDQAQALKNMIEDTFTPTTGIPVNLELINIGILLPATLAGRGPDIALGVSATQPIDFAIRGASVDLTTFPDFPSVAQRFHPSALLPFSFRDAVYALPETQTFPMLFFRKDILAELGLSVPKTWEDVLFLIPDLQKEHMDFGLPYSGVAQAATGAIGESSATLPVVSHGGVSTYLTFLYQNGAELYKNDGVMTNLDSEVAIEAFSAWTELYELYNLPLWYDAANRFRMGEMPVLISDFGLYNFLSVFAPELRGEWDFTLVPGVRMENGEINRTVPVSGPGTMMLDNAKDKEAAWEFMKWWTSTETQTRFGRELESLMGPAARYPTANLAAVQQLPWTIAEYELLEEQRAWAKGVPNVPGAYMVGRHLDNAFRRIVYYHEPARETLLNYNRVMNEEIRLKRSEFGLETTLDSLPLRWQRPIGLPEYEAR